MSVKLTIPNAPMHSLDCSMGKDLDTGQYTRVDDEEFDSLMQQQISVNKQTNSSNVFYYHEFFYASIYHIHFVLHWIEIIISIGVSNRHRCYLVWMNLMAAA